MKVYLDSVGCRLNQSEIEKIARQFRADGHTIASSAAEADLIVVNTCAVTNAAASDSRQKIRQAARTGSPNIAVTGCWVTLESKAASEMAQVKWVVSNLEKESLAAIVLGKDPADYDLEPIARDPLPGAQLRTRAFIKVQDGCDNFCTFCVTRLARGAGRSVPIEMVLADIRAAINGDAKEVVLSGVHLGSWGQDLSPRLHLCDLVDAILADTDIERLRLSSLEPWDLNERFFRLWDNPRMCRHLHLPLQSGCDATLKRMVRHTTPEEFLRLMQMARSTSEAMAVTTDLIVGFPGENEEEFESSLEFVQSMAFAGGHVFTYSLRPGTPAARLQSRVPGDIARKRSQIMRAVLAESSRKYRRDWLGQSADVLWESTDNRDAQGWRLHGLTDTYIRVEAASPQPFWNQITRVKLVDLNESGMLGEIQPVELN
jgi:threonylcarbamoyladenosine tRNA methylthiotransferase MtaB